MKTETVANADAAELAKFNAVAQSWWDPRGPFRPLHDLNPLRLKYICDGTILGGRLVADVGCGGGILAEALCKAGARVTAIDLARDALDVARLHAIEGGLRIDYRLSSVEDLAAQQPEAFDVVSCMEMLEHVPDPVSAMAAIGRLAKPGGSVFISTLNRNVKAFALAIVGAEYLLRMVPRGTHDYSKFIRPSELARWARQCGLELIDLAGISYNPVTQSFRISADTSVNYIAHFQRNDV